MCRNSRRILLLAELHRDWQDHERKVFIEEEALKIHEIDEAYDRLSFYTSPDLAERCRGLLVSAEHSQEKALLGG